MPINPENPYPNLMTWQTPPGDSHLIRTRNGGTNLMMPAKFYINDHLLPVTPHTFSISQNSKTESESLFDGRPYTRARLMNAQTMTIEFILPYFYDDRICESTWDTRIAWTDYFYELMKKCEPVVISVWYPMEQDQSYSQRWILDSWDYTQSAENGSDWNFTLTLTEWYAQDNLDVDFVLENPNIQVGARDSRRV